MDILDLATCVSLPKVAKESRVSTARDNYWFMPLDGRTSLGSRLDDPYIEIKVHFSPINFYFQVIGETESRINDLEPTH
jgi:hypothetical protein